MLRCSVGQRELWIPDFDYRHDFGSLPKYERVRLMNEMKKDCVHLGKEKSVRTTNGESISILSCGEFGSCSKKNHGLLIGHGKSMAACDSCDKYSPRADRPKLTVGIATCHDFNGIWPTIQSLKIHHAECMDDIELVVIDNEPGGSKHSEAAKILTSRWGGKHLPKYVHFTDVEGTAVAKGKVFEHATGEAVMVMDSHVMLPTGVLRRLIDFYDANPGTMDLYQGPCLADDVTQKDGKPSLVGSHFSPGFRGFMDGQWAIDERVYSDDPFEIPMQGMWLFTCRREAWVGFHPLSRGFDASEQGYIHTKFRKRGHRCWCLPWLKSAHRFGHIDGVKYSWNDKDRIWCYLLSWLDVGYPDIGDIKRHFTEDVQAIDTAAGKRIDAAYFDQLLAQATTAHRGLQPQLVEGGPCKFRSEQVTRQDKCDQCGPVKGTPFDVYWCGHAAHHGDCSLASKKRGIRSCGVCQCTGENL